LYYLRLRRGGEDRISWIPSKWQTFKVRSFYNALSLLPLRDPLFPGRAFRKIGSFEIGVFCVDGGIREDFNFG